MPTFQQTMDLQQAEQRRGQIRAEEHFLSTLVAGLPDLEIRENRAKRKLELTKDDPRQIREHRSLTTELQKLARQRALIEERIAGANYRVKLAKTRLAQAEQPSLQSSGKIRELLRQIAT